MIRFDNKSFDKLVFDKSQIEQFYNSAVHCLDIAKDAKITEVRFKFAYDALIKIGISLIAKQGYKVNSRAGHHVKILEKLSEILKSENIVILGNKMRQDRNKDLYDARNIVSEKESLEYLDFVEEVIKKAKNI